MFLKEIQIRNFRGIEELSLPLDDICVLIGENNAGKSTVLDALRLGLTRSLTRRGGFEEYDYHLPDAKTEPSKAKPIEIVMRFAERKEDEWPDEVSQLLETAEQVDDNNLRSVTLKISSSFDPATNDFTLGYDFLDLVGNPLNKAKNPRTLLNLQQLAPTFYLASIRDAAQEFRARSPFWGPFVRALDIDDDTRAEFEKALSELNQKVLDQHEAFQTVKERLKKTADLLPLGGDDPVRIDAVPSKVFDILSRTQVSLCAKTGARIPITRHGDGTQSLAVMCLFDAFLEAQLEDGYGEHAEPILALEEPEAHLHPSAITAVGKMLQDLDGQKIITTHSGDLLAGIPLKKIRRLRRRGGKISIHQLQDGVLTDDEIKKLDYQVRAYRGSLLFSRCWLLVEGETEGPLLAECGRILGHDLYAKGVSCIEFSQVGVDKFIKLADQLGIEWFVVADNDVEGKKYEKAAEGQLNGRPKKDHIRVLDHGAMEVFLCMEGFGKLYEATIADQKKKDIAAKPGTAEYWDQVCKAQMRHAKTRNALAVAEQMAQKGEASVPKLLREVITQACALAKGAG
jgi:putative ATP-dependent endonuclease of OLD family